MNYSYRKAISRRSFIKTMGAGGLFPLWRSGVVRPAGGSGRLSEIFHVDRIPDPPFMDDGNSHFGVEALLALLENWRLPFYRSPLPGNLAGPSGMIAEDDVVLIKVNAQWKCRGCTNSDVVRGLIRRILDHPDGFRGEVLIVDNGQGRGSLNCDNPNYGDSDVRANAVNEAHSFVHLVDHVFADPRVSAFLLDPLRSTFIADDDHQTDGYRRFEDVSYPCFTTPGGRRVELREGIWTGSGYGQNLKLINVPVLKHHDIGGSEITASLKHMYGLLSIEDGVSNEYRHYAGLGETCGKMISARAPVLNIIDAIWVSHKSLDGRPVSATHQANTLVASQDPVALDYWAAKHVLYPIDGNPRHHPDHENIRRWLEAAEETINRRGGLFPPDPRFFAEEVTCDESRMTVVSMSAAEALRGRALPRP